MLLTRREALSGLLALAGAATTAQGSLAAIFQQAGLDLGDPAPFSFDALRRKAAAMAAVPWRAPEPPYAEVLQKIDYDAFHQIQFRRDHSLWKDGPSGSPVQFFHLGRYFKEPCSIAVVEDGTARDVRYRQSYFDMPEGHVARQLPDGIGYAGFRVMVEDQSWDWMSFLGASYFRAPAPSKQYGMSARGIAIDTGLAKPEEFPCFTHYWLEAVPGEHDRMIVYALLEGESITGAYRFDCVRSRMVVMDVTMEAYPRKPVERLGIAPLTAMYWYSEKERDAPDWRPEVHDCDGLAIWTGGGERIWRPLNNPPQVMTNSFADESPRGFGLLQRDRSFDHYQDDGVFYDRRPSVWVEPVGSWGKGAVQLVEIPTDEETNDNIVAYWVPAEPVEPGRTLAFRYRLSWRDDEPPGESRARVVNTFVGLAGVPGQDRPKDAVKMVVDFSGSDLVGLGPSDGVEAVVSASRGVVRSVAAYPVVGESGAFRALFDLAVVGPEPVDLRLFLRRGGEALSETWLYQHFPDSARGGT